MPTASSACRDWRPGSPTKSPSAASSLQTPCSTWTPRQRERKTWATSVCDLAVSDKATPGRIYFGRTYGLIPGNFCKALDSEPGGAGVKHELCVERVAKVILRGRV